MKIFRKLIPLLFITIMALQLTSYADSSFDLSRIAAHIAADDPVFSIANIQGLVADSANNMLIQPESKVDSSMRSNDHYIYMCTKKNLYTIDVTEPSNPILSGNIPVMTDEVPAGLKIDSGRIYLFDRNKIHVFSIIDPAAPSFLKTIAVNDPANTNGLADIAVKNGILYTASGYDGVHIFDFTDLGHVTYLGKLNDIRGFCKNINFAGEYAFVGTAGANAAEVLDISDIMRPKATGVAQITCYDRSGWIDTVGVPEHMEIKDDHIFILNTKGEMSIRKISDPKSMKSMISGDTEALKSSGSTVDSSQNAGSSISGDNDQYLVINNSEDDQNSAVKSTGNKTAYITIDDGPSRSNTTKNLDTLKKYGVKATFFVLPHDNLDDVYKRIIEEGHVIGNHGYVHDYELLYGSIDGFEKDVTKARDYIYKKLGYTSTVYRFPGGSMGRRKSIIDPRAELLGKLGYRYFDWDVSTADTDPNLKKYGTEEQIVNLLANNVIKGAKGKKKLIILMHDSAGKYYSAKALPKIIEGLQKQGYNFDVLTNY